MKRCYAACIILLLLFITSVVYAETKEITSTGKFVMGDLDSKSDAKKIAILNAKQMALEEAGIYLTSVSEVKNYELTNDEITSLAAGIVSTRVLDEKWTMEGESPVIVVVISAVVDTDDLIKKIDALKNNDELVDDLSEMQSEIAALRKELAELRTQAMEDESSGNSDAKQKNERTEMERATIQKLIALDDIKNTRFQIEKGNIEQAVADLSQAISQDASNKDAYLNRSQAYLKMNLLEKAWEDIEKVLKMQSNHVKALQIKGHILLRKNLPRRATESFTKAIEIKQNCGTCYFGRGQSYMMQRQLRKAGNDFKKACSLRIRRGCEELKKLEELAKPMQRNSQNEGARGQRRGKRTPR